MSAEIMCGSFDDHKSYFISQSYEKKSLLKVKIIKTNNNETHEHLEERINNVLQDFNGKFDIVDIKYADTSCMIIYKKL